MTYGGWTSGEEKGGILEKGLRGGEVRHSHGLHIEGPKEYEVDLCGCAMYVLWLLALYRYNSANNHTTLAPIQ